MSAERAFFDTNILIYAYTDDPRRTGIAEDLVVAGGLVSVQVLNEFCAVTRSKLNMPWDRIETALTSIRLFCGEPLPLNSETQQRAFSLAWAHNLHIYDANIVAAAQLAGCALLYTEDLQHGRHFDGLSVVNPFG
ncbi:PIN domain-containing protein [Ferrovibrio sp.]|uniref:PIN domain-containing protein n=1 Tax=Ferrovibrio sp. TaxID=1917215 RepID=UPI001B6D9A26|nr:PIN domain-containing protein [Ferrovibrio sp.]MBP7063102.1 PIN domain-containing protein [Ferrovibrio sp.]